MLSGSAQVLIIGPNSRETLRCQDWLRRRAPFASIVPISGHNIDRMLQGREVKKGKGLAILLPHLPVELAGTEATLKNQGFLVLHAPDGLDG